ncbi:hypothetical protein [Streptomyces sp. NPDC005012]|uniref:hypothetical protein n=1 Tax=Streptomyces sp. NPDC005012 TaxID=3154558 RepID=UPI0033AA920A
MGGDRGVALVGEVGTQRYQGREAHVRGAAAQGVDGLARGRRDLGQLVLRL